MDYIDASYGLNPDAAAEWCARARAHPERVGAVEEIVLTEFEAAIEGDALGPVPAWKWELLRAIGVE